MTNKVVKRNGDIVEFDFSKIVTAVKKAYKSCNKELNQNVLEHIDQAINLKLNKKKDKIMSNSKVRKQLEALEAKTKKYSQYKKIENVILNYQMCKAFFHDPSVSIIGVVEMILKEKYNLPWQLKFIRKVTMEARGKKNPLIVIPQFKYEERVDNILSKFVKKNFDKMAADQKKNGAYPFVFRDIMEK